MQYKSGKWIDYKGKKEARTHPFRLLTKNRKKILCVGDYKKCLKRERQITWFKTKTRRKAHKRRTKRGKTPVREHDMRIKKKGVVIITKKERKLFDELTKKGGRELAMVKDFKNKDGKIVLNKSRVYLGDKNEVDFSISDKDDVVVHTHPPNDILAFSPEDIKETLKSKNPIECIIHRGSVLCMKKPRKLNKKKIDKEYSSTFNNLLHSGASDRKIRETSSKILKKNGFKLRKDNEGIVKAKFGVV